MFKKYLTLFVTILILNLSLGVSVFAKTNTSKETKLAEKLKASITKLGTGKDARVEIKLRNKTKLKGYISQINENTFVVIDGKTNLPNEVAYRNAKQVKGNNLNTGVKIAIGVVIVLIIFAIIGLTSSD